MMKDDNIEIQKMLYQNIKDKNILKLHETLNKYSSNDELVAGEIPFWLQRFQVIVKELEKSTDLTLNSELFWLDIQRSFIDVIPR